MQISVLVPEIFKFEKWVKYANEMTDDVIHSTKCYKTKLIANLVLRQKGKIYWPIFQLAELVFFRAST